MDNLGQYVLSVTITALICAITSSMVPSETAKAWIRLICGLVLTITVLKPIVRITDMELTIFDPITWTEGTNISDEGREQSRKDMADIIKHQSEAYIVDKAKEFGTDLTARITVNDDPIPIPVSVELRGSISAYQKRNLESFIQDNLDITKENIQWMEPT